MRVQKVKLHDQQYIWLVIDDHDKFIQPIQKYIQHLFCLDKSPYTLKGYAHHLKLYWEFIENNNLKWNTISINQIEAFVSWLRRIDFNYVSFEKSQKRKDSSMNTMLSAILGFYEFHRRFSKNILDLTYQKRSLRHPYPSLLSHVKKNRLVKRRLIKLHAPKTLPKLIPDETIKSMIDACNLARDRFLIALLYETGMRIGQALGLRHQDIRSWDNEVYIQPRKNNINEARAKSSSAYIVHVSSKLMKLYHQIQTGEKKPEDYVFLECPPTRGQPLAYPAVYAIFKRLSQKIGTKVTPHLFRHTHATQLLKAGWSPVLVQKRLGHAHVNTTIDTYVHLADEDLKVAFENFSSKKTIGGDQ
jgi:integrase